MQTFGIVCAELGAIDRHSANPAPRNPRDPIAVAAMHEAEIVKPRHATGSAVAEDMTRNSEASEPGFESHA